MTLKPKVWMACPLCGKQSPMPDPDVREWVGLTQEEIEDSYNADYKAQTRDIEDKLRSKNT